MNIVRTIENDIVAVWHIIEADAVKFGAIIWQDAQPILKQVEPAVYAELRKVIVGIAVAFTGKDLPTIEAGLLNVLSAAESALLAEAQALGSDLLQLLISEVMAA